MKWFKLTSLVLIIFNSAGALAGGAVLMSDPSGGGMQMPVEWLRFTSFNDYFIPGLVLFTCNGLFGLVVIVMILANSPLYPLFIILQGLLLSGWIIIQVMLLHTINFLHVLYILIGLALIVLGFLQKKKNLIAGN